MTHVCCDCGVDCSVILMLDGTLCAVTGVDCCYTDAGWHSVCCDCGVDCSVILMLDSTLLGCGNNRDMLADQLCL